MTRQFVSLDKRGTPALDRRRGGRATERMVAATAIGLAAAFVALALLSIVLTDNALGAWVPVHLLLAGAATTAIAGLMPFFSAAITNAPAAPGWLRFGAVIAVALGALLVVGGRIVSPGLVGGNSWLAGVGGMVFIVGLALVGAATLVPLRLAIGSRRTFFGLVYGMALVNVICGATLASLLLLGWLPALQDWPALKPAHAWLNVFGFVSLVIAGTLLHLLPTVVGTRIRDTPASIVACVAVAAGPPVAALGFITNVDVLAQMGAATLVCGAIALAIYTGDVIHRRARWTTDANWHLFSTTSLAAGVAWFLIGSLIAAWSVFMGGATTSAWQLAPLIAPVLVGWVGQVLAGAWTHLVPAVGPGLAQRHARQRQILGRGVMVRLALLNVGVTLMVIGNLGIPMLLAVGGAAVLAAAVGAMLLLGLALAQHDEPALAHPMG
ncbi:MAG TPA: hypothetical protein VH371_06215 [Candidatus Limnocylindrales bacterium]